MSDHLIVYVSKCKRCGKVVVSVSKSQVYYNMMQHFLKCYPPSEELPEPVIDEREV